MTVCDWSKYDVAPCGAVVLMMRPREAEMDGDVYWGRGGDIVREEDCQGCVPEYI